MDIDLNNLDFALAVNTFHDDVQDKLELLTKLELQFLRKFQHRVKLPEHHQTMVYEIRKILANIEEMYKDVYDYFQEMKIPFLYQFIRKVQNLMVIGYNHLSQALLITFDMYEEERKKENGKKEQSICSCQSKSDFILSKQQLKRLQKIDYTINSLETEEERLKAQIEEIYGRIALQKGLVQKVKPSLAAKQLEEMKDHVESIMEKNQKLFEENYMMKFKDFQKQLKKIDRPEQITEIYHQINNTLKDNFIKQTLRAAQKIQKIREYRATHMENKETQTCSDQPKQLKQSLVAGCLGSKQPPVNSQRALNKEKKLNEKLNIEINQLQKKIAVLNEELDEYKSAEREIEINYRELTEKYVALEELYQKNRGESQTQKLDSQWQIQKQSRQIQNLKSQILKMRENSTRAKVMKHIETQTIEGRKKPPIVTSSSHGDNDKQRERTLLAKAVQTLQPIQFPRQEADNVKLLKNRNEKAILMLNQKDRKIRELNEKTNIQQTQKKNISKILETFFQSISQLLVFQNRSPETLKQDSANNLIANPQRLEEKLSEIQNGISRQFFKAKQIKQAEQTSPELKYKKLKSLAEENMQQTSRNQTYILNSQGNRNTLGAVQSNISSELHSTESGLKSQGITKIAKKKRNRISMVHLLTARKSIDDFKTTEKGTQVMFTPHQTNSQEVQTEKIKIDFSKEVNENIQNKKNSELVKNFGVLKDFNKKCPVTASKVQRVKAQKETNSIRNSQSALRYGGGKTKKSVLQRTSSSFQKIRFKLANGQEQSFQKTSWNKLANYKVLREKVSQQGQNYRNQHPMQQNGSDKNTSFEVSDMWKRPVKKCNPKQDFTKRQTSTQQKQNQELEQEEQKYLVPLPKRGLGSEFTWNDVSHSSQKLRFFHQRGGSQQTPFQHGKIEKQSQKEKQDRVNFKRQKSENTVQTDRLISVNRCNQNLQPNSQLLKKYLRRIIQRYGHESVKNSLRQLLAQQKMIST